MAVLPITPLPAPAVCNNNCPPWLGPQGDSITCVPQLPGPSGTPLATKYIGNGTSQDIVLGYDPDIVFIKNDNVLDDWMFQTRDQPIDFIFQPNINAARFLRSNYITSFLVTGGGFSIGNGPNDVSGLPEINAAGDNYTAWAFSKFPGFLDTGSYIGDGTAFQVVPHNLSVVPELIITKEVTSSSNWQVYHKDMGEKNTAYLNTPTAFYTDPLLANSTAWGQTLPTDLAFSVGGDNNLPTESMFMVFASLPGVCKVGSYVSDGSVVQIDTDFIPSQILLRNAFVTQPWVALDIANNPLNPVTKELKMSTQDPLATVADVANFFLDRIEITTTDIKYNNPGDTYIYIAFGY